MMTMTLEQVRDWHRSIAESSKSLRAIADPHKAAANAIDAELQIRFECLMGVIDILDGKDTGVGICNEPWQSVRMRLIELVKRQASMQGVGDKLYTTPPAAAVPNGWKLVPIEPTEEMVVSGFECDAWDTLSDAAIDKKGWPYSCKESAQCVTDIFTAMLNAAPQPEAKE